MEPIREAEMQTQPGKRLAEEPKRKKAGKGMENGGRHRRGGCCRAFCACCMLANSRDTFFPTYHHQRRGSGRPDGGRSPVPAGS